jgi:MFS transporter, AAHS family, 4-hydroxybenzoate transporter
LEAKVFSDLVDERALSRLQIVTVALCVLVAVMDGFDTQAIGYVAPAIVESWRISKLSLGPVFSAGLIGSLLGALTFGLLADKYGRKPILLLCMSIFGIAATASAAASSVPLLLSLRFITGLGLGGAMPIAIAQTSEFMPKRIRSLAVTFTYVGFSVGAALGGVVADQVIRYFSWNAVFIAGGVPTLVLAAVIAALLPESVAFLMGRSNQHARLQSVLERVGIKPDVVLKSAHARPRMSLIETVAQLFKDGRQFVTAGVWLVIFANLMQLYFFSNWLPVMLHGANIAVGHAALITALFQVGGSIGAIAIGILIDRYSKFAVLGGIFLCGAAFIGLVGVTLDELRGPMLFQALALIVTLAGVCVVGGQIGAIAAASTLYPDNIRTSGVGWALGIGRIGSVVGPFLGSALIANQLPLRELFAIGAIPALVASLTSILISQSRYQGQSSVAAPEIPAVVPGIE